jgi:hypothetical protein
LQNLIEPFVNKYYIGGIVGIIKKIYCNICRKRLHPVATAFLKQGQSSFGYSKICPYYLAKVCSLTCERRNAMALS